MSLARVDHQDSGRTSRPDQVGQRRDDFEKLIYVISETFAKAARQQEVSLHVDDDQRGLAWHQTKRRRLCGHFDWLAHTCSSVMIETCDSDRDRGSSRICAASCSTVSSARA